MTSPYEYWAQHLLLAKRGSNTRPLLYRAMRSHGVENFTFTVVEDLATDAEAMQAERYWIDRLQLNRSRYPYGKGYNLTDGGDGHSGFRQSAETKEKRAARLRGLTRPKWTRPHPRKGLSPSDETRRLMSEAKKGRPRKGPPRRMSDRLRAAFCRKGKTSWNKGISTGPLSEETRRRMSLARAGRSNAGAFVKGAAPHNKVSDEVVDQLRQSRESHAELGRRFGLHRKTVAYLRKRQK
jgi:group I intron endonuclease